MTEINRHLFTEGVMTGILLGVIMTLICTIAILTIVVLKNKKNNEVEETEEFEPEEQVEINRLSFDEVNEIIDYIMNDIVNNKWFLYYRLKEIKIIKKMDDDIAEITKEIIAAFSPDFMLSANQYYTPEFFITMITRRVQVKLIEYTQKYKPNAK